MKSASLPQEPGRISVKVHVLLIVEGPCRLLTIQREGQPHLPRFFYDESRPYSPILCCKDLAEALDLNTSISPFRVVAKLLPPVNDDPFCSLWNPDGTSQLLLLDTTAAVDLNLAIENHAKHHTANPAEITKVSVVRKLIFSRDRHEYRRIRSAALPCISPCYRSSFTSSNRCAHTRIQGVIEFLETFVRDSGLTPKSYVERHAWDSGAPLFKLYTDDGWYYVKSAPLGTKEVSITQCIASLFPKDTLLVTAADLALNCFITKGFYPHSHDLCQRICGRKLARLQHQSLEHLDALKKAGLPDYSPPVLATKFEVLAADPKYSSLMQSETLSAEEVTSTLKDLCYELDRNAIPNTLVHGDFTSRNFGVRSGVKEDGGLILYDWEGSCLSHPFCDLHNNLDEWSSDEFLDEYLGSWSRFVDMEESRRCVKIGKVVGAVLRICHLMNLAAVSPDCDKSAPLEFIEYYIPKVVASVEKWSSRAS